MTVDHIGIVVRSLEPSIQLWKDQFGYRQVTEPVINTRQKVRVVFLEKPGSIQIKLIEPTEAASPVFGVAQRGGGLHHLCFNVGHLGDAIEHLQKHGGRVVAQPQPGEAFDDEPIAFVLAQSGLNVELIATDKRRARARTVEGGQITR